MMRTKIGFNREMRVFISHMHGDHVLGLPGMIQSMALLGRDKPLSIYGPEGIAGFLEAIDTYVPYVSGFETSPYGIEWMRFEHDSPVSELVKTVPHIAFEVDNLEIALEGKRLISEISSPSKGVRVAMIIDNDAPIELLEFSKISR